MPSSAEIHPRMIHSNRLRSRPLLVLLATMILTIPAGPAAAASSREQAAATAVQQNGGAGRVLGVREEQDGNGRRVYAVQILIDGRVRIILVPAN